MASCIRCGRETATGGLCPEHAEALSTCAEITAEQLRFAAADRPAAYFVDQWGVTHPIAASITIGRADDCEVGLLHHSVSALHAELAIRDSGIQLRDRGSLNGTFVNREPLRSGRVFGGDVLQFGDVSLLLMTGDVPAFGAEGGTGRTVPTRSDELAFSVTVQAADRAVELIGRGPGGGVARTGDAEIELGKLEFGLLELLIRRREEQDDLARAYVPSAELARTLEFNSVAADSENVRELVRRVRKKLKTAGVADLIESRKGAGYRFAWPTR
jgi:hypothetical protein